MARRTLIIYPILFAITLAIATFGFSHLVQTHYPPYLVTLKYYVLFFVVAKVLKDNSIFNLGWGLGFVAGSVAHS